MPAQRPLRLAPEWDDRFTRMVVLSAVLHAAAIAGMLWLLVGRGGPAPLPMVAYTVEITDPSALGGRMPSGQPGQPLTGGPAPPPAPEPRPEAEQAPKGEVAKAPEPKPEAKPPAPEPPPAETKPEPKPEAKPEQPPPTEPPKPPAQEEHEVHLAEKPKPPEAKPPEPKPVEKPPEPKPAPKPEAKTPAKPEPKSEPAKTAAAKPAPPKPAPKAEAAGKSGTPAGQETHDDYAAAAERWRARAGKQGGGLGGADTGSGPIGSGGQGPGGGGQLVGLEFMAYRQQVINTIKAQWANVIARPGLVAAVRFEIAPDGEVSGIKLAQSSGNPAYDASAIRAVQHVHELPPPPARYASEFREFVIEFHSEETGGQGAG